MPKQPEMYRTVTEDEILEILTQSNSYLKFFNENPVSVTDEVNQYLRTGERKLSDPLVGYIYSKVESHLEKVWYETKNLKKYGKITPHISNRFEIGAIILYTWGSSDTKNYFYCIVEMTPKSVVLLRLNDYITEMLVGPMAGYATSGTQLVLSEKPIKKVIQTPIRKVSHEISVEYLSMEFGNAYLWDGRKAYESWGG